MEGTGCLTPRQDDDCAEDDKDYEGWVVEYYPDESPSDSGPSGAGVEWSPVGWIKDNGPCGKFVKWISE